MIERHPIRQIRFSFSHLEACPLSTNDREKRVRVNRQIRISPVRVIDSDGEQLGVLPIEEALAAAEERGLDLVEVAPTGAPPVVKIMDYGKFKFEEAKAARAAKKKQHVIQLKEVKYRPGIDDHDFDFKTRHAREFLGEGNKVKVTMMFRGRQIAHLELGKAVLDRVAAALADVGKVEHGREARGAQHDDGARAEVDGSRLGPPPQPTLTRGEDDAEEEDQARGHEALQA